MGRPHNERQMPAPPVEQVPGLPAIILASTPPLRRSKRIEERQQREAARQARLVEAAENNEVDWEAFMLQELLVDEREDQEEENNYENIEDRTIVELQCTEQLNWTGTRNKNPKGVRDCKDLEINHLCIEDVPKGSMKYPLPILVQAMTSTIYKTGKRKADGMLILIVELMAYQTTNTVNLTWTQQF